MKLLLTAFEPFANEPINSSLEVARAVVRRGVPGAAVTLLALPVVRYLCVERALVAIDRLRPELIIALGQAGSRSQITPERVALNVDDFELVDNAGNQPFDEPAIPGAPAAYFCHLPVRRMVERLRAAEIPAAVSNTAGTFVCNHLTFGLLHHIATQGLPVRAGFIHVPYLTEQAAGKSADTPGLSLEVMVRGISLCLKTALATESQYRERVG